LKIESLQAELAEQKKISTISFAGVEGKKAEKEEDKKQLTEDETLKAEYEGDEKIQAEFSTVESFMSYRKHIGK